MKHSKDPRLPRGERHTATRTLLEVAHDDRATDLAAGQAMDRVIVINMPVAASLASRHKDRGIPLEDLEQVAHLALVRAARQFDPHRERDFLSYAVPTIRGELRKHFRDYGWTVRPPRRVQEAQTRVVAARDSLAERDGHTPTAAEIAEHLDEDLATVQESLAAQGCFHPTSLDLSLGEETGGTTLGDQLGGEDPALAAAEARVVLSDAVRRLSPRDREIIRLRFFEDRTQQEVADRIGVTQMQVSRLLGRILRDLRHVLEDQDGALSSALEPRPAA